MTRTESVYERDEIGDVVQYLFDKGFKEFQVETVVDTVDLPADMQPEHPDATVTYYLVHAKTEMP